MPVFRPPTIDGVVGGAQRQRRDQHVPQVAAAKVTGRMAAETTALPPASVQVAKGVPVSRCTSVIWIASSVVMSAAFRPVYVWR